MSEVTRILKALEQGDKYASADFVPLVYEAHFNLAGRYVWHCHILEPEDNEVMRPLIIS